jgi:hypothetical protein
MLSTLEMLISRMDRPELRGADILDWGSPVPSFGDVSRASVATLGLNPSNREFVDTDGNELNGDLRRFHTLASLGIKNWIDATPKHRGLIADACRNYFFHNPYDGWFRKLDQIIAGTNASYYCKNFSACHLDLVPYATSSKWTELTNTQRSTLLKLTNDSLALLLRDSPVGVLVLNGKSVVREFESVADITLDEREMASWALPRRENPVRGFSYQGVVDKISDIPLGREVLVLGYNHNIQSSFGVTTEVCTSIGKWVSRMASAVLS